MRGRRCEDLRRAAGRLGLVAVGLALALIGLEVALRLFWCSTAAATFEYQSKPFLSANPFLGTWHFPNDDVEHRRACFDVHYRTNEWGMKNGLLRPGTRRVAMLGDSFVEGFGHSNETTAGHFLERMLGRDFQVLNFGVSFYYSTADELVMYDDFAKFFDPEIVLVFFLNYNDLEDALDPKNHNLIDRDGRFVYPHVASLAEIAPSLQQQEVGGFAGRPDSRLCLLRFLRFVRLAVARKAQMALDFRWDFHHEFARPYLPEDADMRRAWSIVEASLVRLAELTRERGAKLVVISIADPYQLDDQWLRLMALREGTPLSPTGPNERLASLCAKHGIRHYDLYPETKAYLREHDLHYPFLSFPCDRHFDVEGQQLMAALVFQYLQREHLLEPLTKEGS